MDEKIRCPYCKSEDMKHLTTYHLLSENYVKSVSSNSSQTGIFMYDASKYLCLGCGIITDIMSSQQLKDYNENQAYFVKDQGE